MTADDRMRSQPDPSTLTAEDRIRAAIRLLQHAQRGLPTLANLTWSQMVAQAVVLLDQVVDHLTRTGGAE